MSLRGGTLDRNKTKITGLVIAVLGALQAASPQLQAVMSPRTYAITMIFLGVLVSVFGFLNSQAGSAAE